MPKYEFYADFDLSSSLEIEATSFEAANLKAEKLTTDQARKLAGIPYVYGLQLANIEAAAEQPDDEPVPPEAFDVQDYIQSIGSDE